MDLLNEWHEIYYFIKILIMLPHLHWQREVWNLPIKNKFVHYIIVFCLPLQQNAQTYSSASCTGATVNGITLFLTSKVAAIVLLGEDATSSKLFDSSAKNTSMMSNGSQPDWPQKCRTINSWYGPIFLAEDDASLTAKLTATGQAVCPVSFARRVAGKTWCRNSYSKGHTII